MAEAICLRQLRVGERARVVSVAAAGELGRRIRDMGLVPGSDIEVMHRAPLKDPIALRIKDFTLSLRNNEADFIKVERLGMSVVRGEKDGAN